jgi:hypothetical protein
MGHVGCSLVFNLPRAHEKESDKKVTASGRDQPLGKPPTPPVPGPVQPPNGEAHKRFVERKPPTVQEPKVVPDTGNLKQRTLDLANELDVFVQSRNDYWRDHYPEKNAMTAVQLSQSTDALYRGPTNQFPQKVIKIRDEFKVFHIEDEKLNELIARDEMTQQVRAQNPAGQIYIDKYDILETSACESIEVAMNNPKRSNAADARWLGVIRKLLCWVCWQCC